jgi:twitching motility two-component system response regulator PilG
MQSSVPAGEVNETGSEESAATPGADEAKSITIMVIDDSKTIRRTAETLLRKEGFEVIVATDGFEALSMVADNKPDLIFLDVSKDGLFDRARGRVVGSDHYITKPFTRDELLAVISQLCNTADKSA